MRTLLALMLAATALSAQPVFKSGEVDYKLFRIPGLVATTKGTLLAYCEARKTEGDWAAIDLVLKRSSDGGKTWSEMQVIGHVPPGMAKNSAAVAKKIGKPGEITQNNPVMIVDGDIVHLVYCVEYARVFYRASTDDGKTWSEPVEITAAADSLKNEYDWKVIATGPGHGIRLKNGRLLIATWLSLGTGGNAHHPSVVTTLASDDRGKTWKAGSIAVANTADVPDPNETAAAELSNGSVLLNVRSLAKTHQRVQVTSKDGSSGWSEPAFAKDLFEPICFGSMLRMKDKLYFANPSNTLVKGVEGKAGQSRERKNLTLFVSSDDGKTWAKDRTIDEGWAGYSDLAASGDSLYVLYEKGAIGAANFRPESLTLVKVK